MNQSGCPSPESASSATESCCELHPPQPCPPTPCPACRQRGNAVGRLTLGALLKPDRRPHIPNQPGFYFCKTATCDVVYFLLGRPLFRKDDLSVRVGLKAPDDPTVPLCYCFGWTSQKIRAEIEATGKSTAVEQITAHVKAGNCYCEVTNPQGSCCLGNVAQAVKKAMGGREKGVVEDATDAWNAHRGVRVAWTGDSPECG